MTNQNEDLILQEKLDKPDSIESGRRAEELCRQLPSARDDYEKFQKLFHRLETKFAPGPDDQPASASIDGLMTQILHHDDRQTQQNSLPDWLSFNNLCRFAIGSAFVLGFALAFYPARQPELATGQVTTQQAGLFSLENMHIIVTPASENDLILDGKMHKAAAGSTLKSRATYSLKNAAELAISSTHGLLSFKNQASFSFNNNEIKLEAGDVYRSLKGNHQNFIIKTPFASVAPVGTKFSVNVKPAYVKITLFAGKVLVTSHHGTEKTISDEAPVFVLPDGQFSNQPISHEDVEPQRAPASQTAPDSTPEPASPGPTTILDTL